MGTIPGTNLAGDPVVQTTTETAYVQRTSGTSTAADASGTPYSATNRLPVAPDAVSDGALTAPWAAATPVNTAGFGSALIGVSGITGTPTILVTGTLANVIDHSLDVFTLSGSAVQASITANGLYQVPGAGSLKYTITGGTATVNLMLKR